jgi:hypothetical protein
MQTGSKKQIALKMNAFGKPFTYNKMHQLTCNKLHANLWVKMRVSTLGYSIPPLQGSEPAIANAWNPTTFVG